MKTVAIRICFRVFIAVEFWGLDAVFLIRVFVW